MNPSTQFELCRPMIKAGRLFAFIRNSAHIGLSSLGCWEGSSAMGNIYFCVGYISDKEGPKLKPRELLAFAIDPHHACGSYLSIQSGLGPELDVGVPDIAQLPFASDTVQKIDAILRLAHSVIMVRRLNDADLNRARHAGLDDDQIVEIVASLVLNISCE